MGESTETNELIVKFERGVSEDTARDAAAEVGATVRRRMRADHPDEVMLLLRVEKDMGNVQSALDGRKDVAMTEVNQGGFRPAD